MKSKEYQPKPKEKVLSYSGLVFSILIGLIGLSAIMVLPDAFANYTYASRFFWALLIISVVTLGSAITMCFLSFEYLWYLKRYKTLQSALEQSVDVMEQFEKDIEMYQSYLYDTGQWSKFCELYDHSGLTIMEYRKKQAENGKREKRLDKDL